MECKDIGNHIADYLTTEMAAVVREDMESHLERCDSCRLEVAEMKDLWRDMGSLPVAPPNADRMRARFETLVDSPPPARGTPEAWRLSPAYQAIAAVLLLLAGMAIGMQISPVATPASEKNVLDLREEVRAIRDEVLLAMQQQSAAERLRGISWSNHILQPDSPVLAALLDALKHDPNVNVRVACVGALERFGQQESVRKGLLEALNQREFPVVQAAAIDAVVTLKEKASVQTLQRLATDSATHESIRKQAEWALKQLS